MAVCTCLGTGRRFLMVEGAATWPTCESCKGTGFIGAGIFGPASHVVGNARPSRGRGESLFFCHPDADPAGREALSEGRKTIEIGRHWTMAHIAHATGTFPSVSQARRNGWDRPIPAGFSTHEIGPRRSRKQARVLMPEAEA